MLRQCGRRVCAGVAASAAAVTICLAVAGPAAASGPFDLASHFDMRVDGALRDDFAGWSVADVGDVNGDGISDFAVGAPGAGGTGFYEHGAGIVYVIFGRPAGAVPTCDLAHFPTPAQCDGFEIQGVNLSDWTGNSVSSAGDMNGDGKSDILVGAKYYTPSSGSPISLGAAFVVFGKSTEDPVHLGTIDAPGPVRGFRIQGESSYNYVGDSVAPAGDVNGDGIPDVIVAGENVSPSGRIGAGAAYVVFGKKDNNSTVDLAALGNQGFRINGVQGASLGYSVAGMGDLNGDARADVAVQSIDKVYVIFGKATGGDVDTASLGSQGYTISSGRDGLSYENAMTSIGDLNGDGKRELVVGSFGSNSYAGATWVVWGKGTTTSQSLGSLSSGGFEIDGAPNDRAGWSVSAAKDVNLDGKPDVVVGAGSAAYNGRYNSGSIYVVYGKNTTTSVSLASLGTGGYRIDGAKEYDDVGNVVAGLGDMNGDGRSEIAGGAKEASNNTAVNQGVDPRTAAGSVYVLFGQP
jgi:hypothetical protein